MEEECSMEEVCMCSVTLTRAGQVFSARRLSANHSCICVLPSKRV